MALNPSAKYPSQIDVDDGYPYGKARNAGSYQDGTGTPLEKDWLNDQWGLNQALLNAAAIVPSGDPDTAISSQYLAALLKITRLRYAHAKILDTPTADGDDFTLEGIPDNPNTANGMPLSFSGKRIFTTEPGFYLAVVAGDFRTSKTGTNAQYGIKLEGEVVEGSALAVRPGSDVNHHLNLTILGLGRRLGVGANNFGVSAAFLSGSGTVIARDASLFVLRLGSL